MVARAKHLPTMVSPVGRVGGMGCLVRPTEVRERQQMPSRERRRQSGHLEMGKIRNWWKTQAKYLRPKPAAKSPVKRAVAIASPPLNKE